MRLSEAGELHKEQPPATLPAMSGLKVVEGYFLLERRSL